MSINNINNGDSGLSARKTLNKVVDTTNLITNATDITYVALQELISGNKLSPNSFYKITDADPDLYGGVEIILQADSPSTLNSKGIGKFYNPIYNQEIVGYGIWTQYTSFTATNLNGVFNASIPYGEIILGNLNQLGNSVGTFFEGNYNFLVPMGGDWSTATSVLGKSSDATADMTNIVSPTYSIGDTTIWGGKVWINKTGNPGSNVNAYTLNPEDWELIGYSNTEYYAISWDEIEFDIENNFIISRKEILSNNTVEQTYQNWVNWNLGDRAIAAFQWGNIFKSDISKGLENNYVSDSYIELINFRGSVCYQNSFTQYAYIINNDFELNTEITNNQIINSYIYNNFFGGNSIIFDSNFLVNSNINANSILGYSKIASNNFTNTVINQNIISSGGIVKNAGNNANINYNGIFNDSQIVENNLTSGDVTCNNLSNQSLIAYNSLNLNSIIANNALGVLSEISRNTLSNTSQIVYNVINNNGLINNNNVSNLSVIYNNPSVDNITNNIISNYYYLENTSILEDTSFIKVKNIGETLVNEYALNFGINNIIRSELGVTLGSGNYVGGIVYNGTLTAKSKIINIPEDVTSAISINDIIYVISNSSNRSFTRVVTDVGLYVDGVTQIEIDEEIDDKTTSVTLSQNTYGVNTFILGTNSTSTGNNSLLIGDSNENSTSNSLLNGISGISKFDTDRVISGKSLSFFGDCQSIEVMIGCKTTDNTITDLTLHNGDLLTLSINGSIITAYKYKVEVLAMETDDSALQGDAFTQTITGLMVEKGGVLQEVGSQIISETINDPAFGGSIIITADYVNKALRVQAVGQLNKDINWVAKVTLIQTYF